MTTRLGFGLPTVLTRVAISFLTDQTYGFHKPDDQASYLLKQVSNVLER